MSCPMLPCYVNSSIVLDRRVSRCVMSSSIVLDRRVSRCVVSSNIVLDRRVSRCVVSSSIVLDRRVSRCVVSDDALHRLQLVVENVDSLNDTIGMQTARGLKSVSATTTVHLLLQTIGYSRKLTRRRNYQNYI